MCGIAGFHHKHKGVVKQHERMELFANLLLTGIEQRGRQATGFVAVTHDGKKYEIDKRAMNAKEFIEGRKPLPEGTRTFLGHTRYATQGSNENHANLHPVISGTCLTVHNGGIWNDDKLFEEHGIKRSAEVDTEAIPALIHKFGWENAAKALHELHGSFAIASIDLKHPGEVLLAKGDWSPLYWIETDNFIVWASTDVAIRNAWKEVLGTPPMWNKFHKLNEGDMLWIKGHVTEPARFELPTDPFRRADNPKRQASASKSGSGAGGNRSAKGGVLRPIFERQGSSTKHSGSGWRSSTLDGSAVSTDARGRGVIPDRTAEVKQLRADGNGKAVIHRTKTHEELKLIAPEGIVFRGCGGCGELILEQSFVYRTGEGQICTDCNYIAEWSSRTLSIDEGTRTHLNNWANKESFAHGAALKSISRSCGLSAAAIDYLVFRAPPKYLDEHPAMADLADKLDDLYQEAYAAAFDEVLDGAIDKTEVDGPRGSEDEKPWKIADSKNNVHPITQKWLPETCATCKKFKRKDADCTFCARVKDKTEAEKEQTKLDPFKCWCGEPSDRIVGGIVGFCRYHFEHCNHEDCEYGVSKLNRKKGVVAPANHLLSNGKRVCHFHARSQKGAFSDKALEQKGVNVRDTAGAGASIGGL